MFKKILLGVVLFTCLAWIGYVAYDILTKQNDYNPTALFGTEDGEIAVLLNSDEISLDQIAEFNHSIVAQIASAINFENVEKAYFSLNRDHMLLEAKENWSESSLKMALGESVEINGKKIKSGKYSGRFNRKNLYLSTEEYPENESLTDAYKYDVKASAALIKFGENNTIQSNTDIYYNHNGNFEYITKNKAIVEGRKVNDQMVFGGMVTRNFSSYEFYERDYLASQDSIFASGPMYQWVLNGLLVLDYKGSQVLISDYVPGQEPLMVLSDRAQVFDTTIFEVPLTKQLDGSKKYHVAYLEDLVVISTSKNTCEKVVADYKLGQTIALSQSVKNKLFANLPQEVSYRFVKDKKVVAKSVYQGKLMETRAGGVKQKTQVVQKKESLSMGGDHAITDFVAFEGDGNVITLSEDGYLSRYVKEKREWDKQLEGEPLGPLQLIDLHGNGTSYVLFNTKDKIYLYGLNGDSPTGFPIALEEDAQNEAKFYRWKGKSYFMIALDNGNVVHFDAHGRELNIIKTGMLINDQIDVWASNSRLFSGYRDDNKFVMYDMDKDRVHREFNISSNVMSLKVPNELLHYGIVSNQLTQWDQKGDVSKYMTLDNPKLITISNDKLPVIVVRNNNEIHLFNMQGLSIGSVRVPFNEIDYITVAQTESGQTLVGVIDGLENNVYLYNSDGELITKKGFEGQKKVDVLAKKGTVRITTIVDQFVIQYFEN